MSQRLERLADSLRAEIASILQREMKDPRVQLATVSAVRVSRDLSHATVLVSVLGNEEVRGEAIETLKRARGFVRSRLASRVRTRTVPELHFELDRGAEHSQHMSELLATLYPEGDGEWSPEGDGEGSDPASIDGSPEEDEHDSSR
ncbi:MAG: 30S ribosome-binding factor RbfA [Holophagales bacterium]|nr:30S ribosome-binding factor RbfA [Holophagales bacterium]